MRVTKPNYCQDFLTKLVGAATSRRLSTMFNYTYKYPAGPEFFNLIRRSPITRVDPMRFPMNKYVEDLPPSILVLDRKRETILFAIWGALDKESR